MKSIRRLQLQIRRLNNNERYKSKRGALTGTPLPFTMDTDKEKDVWTEVDALEAEFQAEIASASQLGIYLIASSIMSLFKTIKEDMQGGEIDKTNMEMLASIAQLLEKTTAKFLSVVFETRRFGVEVPENCKDALTNADGSDSEFSQWFHWWDKFVHRLAQEDWERLAKMHEDGEDTTSLQPPGTWKVDPNAMIDGVIPASALLEKMTLEDMDSMKTDGMFSVDPEKLQQLKDFKKEDDEIWSYSLVDEKTGEKTDGIAIVSNKRPVAAIEITVND